MKSIAKCKKKKKENKRKSGSVNNFNLFKKKFCFYVKNKNQLNKICFFNCFCFRA